MTGQKTSKAIHISLWVVQVLLAVAFGMAGFMKIAMPIEELAKNGMSFVSTYGVGTVRFIGISEVLGALGLILPAALRIKPNLTPLAAVGIAIIMVLATSYHITHSEPFAPTIILFLMAIFVVFGRFKLAKIQPK